jgi:hypothetical protein
MSKIQVQNLDSTGISLLSDPESFIDELSESNEISSLRGGCTPFVLGLWVGLLIA